MAEFTAEHYKRATRALNTLSGSQRASLILGCGCLCASALAALAIAFYAPLPAGWRAISGLGVAACLGTALWVGRALNSFATERAFRSAKCSRISEYWHAAVLAAYGSNDIARALLPYHADAQDRRVAQEHHRRWRFPALLAAAFGVVTSAWLTKIANEGYPVLFLYSLILIAGSLLVASVIVLIRDVALDVRYAQSVEISNILRESATHIKCEDALAALPAASETPNPEK